LGGIIQALSHRVVQRATAVAFHAFEGVLALYFDVLILALPTASRPLYDIEVVAETHQQLVFHLCEPTLLEHAVGWHDNPTARMLGTCCAKDSQHAFCLLIGCRAAALGLSFLVKVIDDAVEDILFMELRPMLLDLEA
jgi:hypothetical protein